MALGMEFTAMSDSSRERNGLNHKQIHALKQYATFSDGKFRYPIFCGDSSVRASTCFALKRRGLLAGMAEPWDWEQFRITKEGRKVLTKIEQERTIEELGRLLKGVTLCFCTVCCHDRKYGHCYSCNCGNHVPEPIMPEAGKLKQALDHWREIAIGQFKEKFGTKEPVATAGRQEP